MRLRHAADLVLVEAEAAGLTEPARIRKLATWFDAANRTRELLQTTVRADLAVAELLLAWRGEDGGRSEEHTSELQSLMRISYAVFCLKKKTQKKQEKK